MKRILIIDDDDMIRDVVIRLLTLKGFDTISVGSGDKALDHLKTDSDFKAAILDLNMPGQFSGEDVFFEIRKQYPDIKIIISTGFIEFAQAKKFQENGVFGILEKPYKFEDLIQLLNQ